MRHASFFLEDMKEALTRMIEATSDIGAHEFSQNWMLISAVRDQIMVLGEAAKQVPPDIRDQYPEIPWSQLARIRDQLIHGYF
ncbi:MAG TPA: HepT-like ribonuclease domain-containing protein [Methanospirillum sp.]|nr:HepT-like ribonuclease domain-containing protein [Methanospirillum sp.]